MRNQESNISFYIVNTRNNSQPALLGLRISHWQFLKVAYFRYLPSDIEN